MPNGGQDRENLLKRRPCILSTGMRWALIVLYTPREAKL
jgi:hypothetical protein